MSDIQNVETIVHLHYLRDQNGGDLGDLVVHTPSIKYAETTALQSGYARADVPLVMGGQETPIDEVLDFQERGNPRRRQEHEEILAKYRYGRSTVMLWGFDIDFLVRPAP